MTGRSLAYLSSVPIARVRGVGERLARALTQAGLASVADLLLHVPRRYIDRSVVKPIGRIRPGEEATVVGTVEEIASRRARTGRPMVQATVSDPTGSIRVVWFNQPYREGQLGRGDLVALFGKVDVFRGRLGMTNPVTEPLRRPGGTSRTGRVVPIYPSVAKQPSWKIQDLVADALRRSRPILDPVPESILERLGLPSRDDAFGAMHAPDRLEDAELGRQRLVFDEFFRIELALAMAKRRMIAEARGIPHRPTGTLVEKFVGGLPFRLTRDQERVVGQILDDLARPHPMHRLLQGEVGSGKTVVAVIAALRVVEGGHQVAIMAPTEVLATQHFLGISRLLEEAGLAPPLEGEGIRLGMPSLFEDGPAVRVALLTSSQATTNFVPQASRDDVLAWVADGKVDVVVGTHALIQEAVDFAGLGLAVIDEQHRFGVAQRLRIQGKANLGHPDVLIMTATPIPRTLSMTLYGDLDVSTIEELPPGRSPVSTEVVPKSEEARVWEAVRREVARSRQVYVVCPLIEESPKIEAASAVAEYERLSALLPGLRLGLLHGQLRPDEKRRVMEDFRQGLLDVLVATTVIEVGIDVPNATLIVVEDAHRFGLSQLHQLRGRVGRGDHPGRCILLVEETTEEAKRRIAAIAATTDGFRLAEEDLAIRGHGTVFGTRQAGLADLRIADLLRDFDLLVRAREEAFDLVGSDPDLRGHPALREEIRAMLGESVAWLFVG
ncbi:MAG: ATP-dependent DNA helicase RecG [Acidimicrobiia bacterium]|nr:MAG: ATP-dependent DNA helicase RecG [Acidimicrobiia bacterium]